VANPLAGQGRPDRSLDVSARRLVAANTGRTDSGGHTRRRVHSGAPVATPVFAASNRCRQLLLQAHDQTVRLGERLEPGQLFVGQLRGRPGRTTRGQRLRPARHPGPPPLIRRLRRHFQQLCDLDRRPTLGSRATATSVVGAASRVKKASTCGSSRPADRTAHAAAAAAARRHAAGSAAKIRSTRSRSTEASLLVTHIPSKSCRPTPSHNSRARSRQQAHPGCLHQPPRFRRTRTRHGTRPGPSPASPLQRTALHDGPRQPFGPPHPARNAVKSRLRRVPTSADPRPQVRISQTPDAAAAATSRGKGDQPVPPGPPSPPAATTVLWLRSTRGAHNRPRWT
jgi:hypothetical protein